jgi:RimJ/RimL family protein N-acetyltransferase
VTANPNFWQGQQVRLRGVEPSDASHFLRWNLDSERARRLDFLWPPQSEAAVRAWVEAQSLKRLENDAYHWVIENLAGEPVGTLSTHDCQPRHGTFSYGIDVAAEHRCRGYASEAIRLVLRYYFHQLRYQKVTVAVHADNLASLALHARLGFVREGTLRRMVFTNGAYCDVVWWGLTREEFDTAEAE